MRYPTGAAALEGNGSHQRACSVAARDAKAGMRARVRAAEIQGRELSSLLDVSVCSHPSVSSTLRFCLYRVCLAAFGHPCQSTRVGVPANIHSDCTTENH